MTRLWEFILEKSKDSAICNRMIHARRYSTGTGEDILLEGFKTLLAQNAAMENMILEHHELCVSPVMYDPPGTIERLKKHER